MDITKFNTDLKRKNELLTQIDKKITWLEARSDKLFNEIREMYKTAYHEGLWYNEEEDEWK